MRLVREMKFKNRVNLDTKVKRLIFIEIFLITGSLTAINGAEPSSEHSANNEYNGFTFEEIIVECLSDEDATGSNGTAISDVNSPASSPVVSKRAKGSTIKSLQLGMGQSIRFNMNVES